MNFAQPVNLLHYVNGTPVTILHVFLVFLSCFGKFRILFEAKHRRRWQWSYISAEPIASVYLRSHLSMHKSCENESDPMEGV